MRACRIGESMEDLFCESSGGVGRCKCRSACFRPRNRRSWGGVTLGREFRQAKLCPKPLDIPRAGNKHYLYSQPKILAEKKMDSSANMKGRMALWQMGPARARRLSQQI